MTDPTPEEIQRVQSYLTREKEAKFDEARRERELAKEQFKSKLQGLFAGRLIAHVAADERSYGGTTDLTLYDLVLTLDNGTRVSFDAEYDGRAVEVYVEEPADA